MKSYFAKLAHRATLADTLRASPAHTAKAADPFEAALLPLAIPASEVAKAKATSNELGNLRLQPPKHEVRLDSAPALFETAKSGSREAPISSTTITPKVRANIPSHEPVLNEKTESQGQRVLRTKPIYRPVPALESTTSAIESSIPPPQPGPLQSKTDTADEREQASDGEPAAADDRLPALERDQAVLLRKADAFMGRLLARRTESKAAPERETSAEPQSIAETVLRPERPDRTQSNPSATPLREDSDRPSLVIGKLTVEVMPPAPPPVAAEQRVIVVHDARSRTAGPISGRRFGLGQF